MKASQIIDAPAADEFPTTDINELTYEEVIEDGQFSEDFETEDRARVEDAEQFEPFEPVADAAAAVEEYEPKYPEIDIYRENESRRISEIKNAMNAKLSEDMDLIANAVAARDEAYRQANAEFEKFQNETGKPAIEFAPEPPAGKRGKAAAKPAKEKRNFFAARPEKDQASAEAARAASQIDEAKAEVAERIENSTMVLFFKLGKPSFKAKMTEDEVQIRSRAGLRAEEEAEAEADDESSMVEIDYSLLTLSKSLLPREALRPIRALDAEWKRQMNLLATPVKVIGNGKFVIPICFVDDADTAVLNFMDMRRQLIETFLDNYEAFIREGMEALGELADRRNYPSREEVRSKFYVKYSWKSFNVPQALKAVNVDLMRREMNRARVEWANAADEIRDGLRAGLYDLIGEAMDKFGSKTEGDKISFSSTFIDKVNRFLETFDGRDLTGDEEVRGMVKNLREVMEGVTDKAIKKDADIRAKVADAFKAVQTQMEQADMIEEGRRLRRREDAEPDRVTAA